MCGKPNQTPNQTPNPATFVLWSVQESQGVSVAESEEAVAGTGTMGGLNSGQKAHVCESQHSDGPAAILAQPSLKEMLGFMLAQKNKKLLCQFQRDMKRPLGALLKGFPSLSELFNLTWCG